MSDTKKGLIIKIIVPVLLMAVVAGIWFVKNSTKDAVAIDDSVFALHVTKEGEIDNLTTHGLPIIIDFGSDTCPGCVQMAPDLKAINEELQGKAIIKFVDVWKYTPLGEGYPISVIPTQIFIDSTGKPYNPKDPDALQMKLYTLKATGEHVFTVHEGPLTKDQMLAILTEMGLKQ